MALLIDVLELSPGEIVINYPISEAFHFELSKNKMQVYEQAILIPDLEAGTYYFTEDLNNKIEYKKISPDLEKSKILNFSKLDNKITFSGDEISENNENE